MSLSTVAFPDQDRNLRVMKQAASRAHRIGQKHLVTIFKSNSAGTVGKQMQPRIARKACFTVIVSCEKAFCERCLEWELTTFGGEHDEYAKMGYSPKMHSTLKTSCLPM